MVACLKSQKLDRIPLRFAIFNIITYQMLPQQNRTRCLNETYFSYNHSSPNKSANLPRRQAIAGQRTVRLLLVLNDAHNPINNPTVQIADPGKQKTLLLRNYTTNRRAISQRWRCMFLSPWHTILAIYSSWSYDTSLVFSDLPNITRLISPLHSHASPVSV